MIVVENLHKHFGGFHAVDGASLEIREGSITGLIGPNGAGKTTLFNVVAGRLPPTSGRVFMNGEDITGLPPHDLFHKGLLRTFQIAHEFSSMTVRENLMMVPSGQSGERIWNSWFARSRIAQEERDLLKKADEVLEFLTIDHLKDEKAGNLSGGQQQQLVIARALATDPKVLLLDEPTEGIQPSIIKDIARSLKEIRKLKGLTILVSEQVLSFALDVADRLMVIDKGRFIYEDTRDNADSNKIAGYLAV